MGVIDTLASGVFADIFLGDEFFAEDVVFWPEGKESNRQEFTSSTGGQGAVVQEHALEGTNEAQGDGRTLVEDRGQAERKAFLIDLPVTANVSDPQNPKRPDKLKRIKDGVILTAVRLVAEDSATKRVLFVRKDTLATRESMRRQ